MDDASKAVAYRTSCDKCGSKDNMVIYRDGHGHCYSTGCKAWLPADHEKTNKPTTTPRSKPVASDTQFLAGKPAALPKRGLSIETTRRWGYLVGQDKNGNNVQIAQHFDDHGNVIVQKLRTADKMFPIIGDASAMTLYGQQLWAPSLKTDILVVEGEHDAHAVDQMFSGTQPVVSVPAGAQSAAKFVKKYAEWLNQFRSVIFALDMDEHGRKATEECVPLVAPGKAKVVITQLKDANDYLLAERADEFREAVKQAKPWRPGGIINGDDIDVEMLYEAPNLGYTTQYPGMDKLTRGFRKGELVMVTAGTGIGKSTIVRQIGHHLNVVHGLSIGNIFLEESYKKTVQGYIAIDRKIPLGDLRQNPELLHRDDAHESMQLCIKNGRTYFYNHFGSLESDSLLSKIDYLASMGVDFILLDHISIAISGQTSSKEGERKDIDILMTKLRSAIERTGIGVIAICHLTKAEKGKSHEEGGQVSLDDLRGSGTLKQIPDTILALERDQQGENPDEAYIRVLKNREFGDLGRCQRLVYSKVTGLLESAEMTPSADDFPDEPKAKPKAGAIKIDRKLTTNKRPSDAKLKKLGLEANAAAHTNLFVGDNDDLDPDIPF